MFLGRISVIIVINKSSSLGSLWCNTHHGLVVDRVYKFNGWYVQVNAQDNDRGPNGQVTYELDTTFPPRDQDDPKLLVINQTSGVISVGSQLDREQYNYIQVSFISFLNLSCYNWKNSLECMLFRTNCII